MSTARPSLLLLAEKILTTRIKNGSMVRYCPTMDLLALVTVEEQVEVYRISGQRVFAMSKRKYCQVQDVCWKPNGALLAVAYSDNTTALVATQGAKTVHQIECSANPKTLPCLLSWFVNFTDIAATKRRLDSLHTDVELDDILHRGFLGELSKPPLDLPGDLAALSVEGVLPKLSVLPAGGSQGDVFTSRASLDALFHSKPSQAGTSDTLVVAFGDGSAYFTVHDFFEVGLFQARQISDLKSGAVVFKVASHPCVSTLTTLLRDSEHNAYFMPVDLRLISNNGSLFSQLASKATQTQNVVRYLSECQVQICSEFETSQKLPHRFIANVDEDLQKDEQCDFITAAYRLVCTGHCTPVLKEWLVDQLADRGQKRWEKAASSGYEGVRRLLHESLLPALDRVNVLCNSLRGLSRFQESAATLGLETIEIDHVLDTVKCLQLLGHMALSEADSELRQSVAFCTWLRQEIESQSAESANANEADKEPTFDYLDVLAFIQGPMLNSVLYEFLDVKKEGDTREAGSMPTDSQELYDSYRKGLKRIREGARPVSRLPSLTKLIDRMQNQCSIIFSRIAFAQQEKIRFSEPVRLGKCDSDISDAHMVVSLEDASCLSFIASVLPERTRIRILRFHLEVQNGNSSVQRSESITIGVQSHNRICDVKFLDDYIVCVLVRQRDMHSLHLLRYNDSESAGSADLDFTTWGGGPSIDNGEETLLALDEESAESRYMQHCFPNSSSPPFVPARLEVNGRKGRRAICVVAEDAAQYRVYDMDTFEQDRKEREDGSGYDDDALMSI